MTTRRGPPIPWKDVVLSGPDSLLQDEARKALARITTSATLPPILRGVALAIHQAGLTTLQLEQEARSRWSTTQDLAAPKRTLFR